MRKVRSLKNVEILKVAFALQVASRKRIIFDHGGKKCRFFLFFIMKLSSTALSYLNAYSILKFAGAFLYF